MASKLLYSLISLSEKACNIARIIREDDKLLSMLVREKGLGDKNPRFIHDFKTFADVLIQAVATHELESQFEQLRGHVYGEENLTFDLVDGSSVDVRIGENAEETENMLTTILGDSHAANLLSKEVHRVLVPPEDTAINGLPSDLVFPDDIAVWIDPIDSTAEYIFGGWCDEDECNAFGKGLHCVTVLLGVFDRHSGCPIAGVVNRPFARRVSQNPPRWEGQFNYGFSYGDVNVAGPNKLETNLISKVILVSSSESESVKKPLKDAGWRIEECAGAGYKLWRVATGTNARAYVLSHGTTFPWDVCAVHAVITAAGGSVVTFTPPHDPLQYSGPPASGFKNGIIACMDVSCLDQIKAILDSANNSSNI